MKKNTAGILAALAAVGMAGTASAQMGPTTPFSVEVRGGASLPTGDELDDLNTGFVVGADAIFQATPMIGLYAGYNFQGFTIDDNNNDDAEAELQGFGGGVRVGFSPMGGFSPFIKGGVLYQKLERSNLDADYETGFQVGGGIDLPLGPRISVTPQATFNSIEDSRWVNVEAGLRIRL